MWDMNRNSETCSVTITITSSGRSNSDLDWRWRGQVRCPVLIEELTGVSDRFEMEVIEKEASR